MAAISAERQTPGVYIRMASTLTLLDPKGLTLVWRKVCEEQGAEDIVFPLAVSYIDRFLSHVRIRKNHLQLLGAVCLFIASKLRQCRALTVDALIYYTDYSVSTKDITTWELLVLSSLKWDMACVVASDFVDPLLARLGIDQEDIVKRHTHTFIALCATEYKFTSYSASLLATACIAVAINGITWLQKPWESATEFLYQLAELTDINVKYIQTCLSDVESLIASNIAQLKQAMTKATLPTAVNNQNCSLAAKTQHEIPKDVHDILY